MQPEAPARTGFRRRHAGVALFVLLLVLGGQAPRARAGIDVHLAWDRSPEPQVTGYIVYVGKAPGRYDEQYDVGNQTSLVYVRPDDGSRYYFAVAAYSPGPIVGALSPPVSHVTGTRLEPVASSTATTAAAREAVPPADSEVSSAPALPAEVCEEETHQECFAVTTLFRTSGQVNALAVLPDDRVLTIEDGTRVVVRHAQEWGAETAFVASARVLADLVVDPAFHETRAVYLSELERGANGQVELTVARYREIQGRLGQRAPIVSGVLVPEGRTAPLAVDNAGNLYVAIPSSSGVGVRHDLYAGTILRFRADGNVPPDAPAASPVFAAGIADPRALLLDLPSGNVWVAGFNGTNAASVAFVEAGPAAAAPWPRPLRAVTTASPQAPRGDGGSPPLIFAPGTGGLAACRNEQPAYCSNLPAFSPERASAATRGGTPGAVLAAFAAGDGTSRVVRLQRTLR